jgi:hypothetical protein
MFFWRLVIKFLFLVVLVFSFNAVSSEIKNKSQLNSYVLKVELLAKQGKECSKSKTNCSSFITYINSKYKAESGLFAQNLGKYVEIDFDLTMRATGAIVSITESAVSVSKHNKKINKDT